MKIIQKLLTKNKWSRPAELEKLNPIKAVVLHWVAAPKQTQINVYNWFESRKNGKNSFGSAHYCVGIDGDAWQFIPDSEMAYHVGSPKPYTEWALKNLSSYPNNCTLGIEMCHLSWEGEFAEETWEGTKKLAALLLMQHNLSVDTGLTTHKLIVGWKECPQWFHRFPEEFDRFKAETKKLIEDGIQGKVVVKLGSLNVRRDADVKSEKISILKNGEMVQLIGLKNGWFKVKVSGFEGYVSSDYIEI